VRKKRKGRRGEKRRGRRGEERRGEERRSKGYCFWILPVVYLYA
jgi:hypothetical protein